MPSLGFDNQYCGDPACTACSLYNIIPSGAQVLNVVSPASNGVINDSEVLNLETRCYCEVCKLKRREPSTIRTGVIHRYDHAPARWQMKRATNDTFPYFMGVELETTRTSEAGGIANEHAADMRRPKRHWIVKRDGSVSGPEFVSHPATLKWWQKNANELAEMFGYLIHAGYRSHNGREAGMHVNISRDAFSNPEHLLRFLNLLNQNPEWARLMSQRTQDQIDSWARFNNRGWTLDRVTRMIDRPYEYHTDKYEVLNAPVGQNRFEFRLPRGTLRVDRFLKNLEWTAGMIGFTRGSDNPTATKFMEWARRHPELYTNLNAFMGERLQELRSAASN